MSIFWTKPEECQLGKLKVRALTLLWPPSPVSLYSMHSAYPAATEAPLHFNFATDVMDRWARERPEALALWCVNAATGAEQKFSFQQLASLSCQAANCLRCGGVREGDRVLVMLPRVPQWWIAMLGLIRLGAVPVPGTLLLTARDVAYRVESARISAVLTDQDGMAKVGGFEGTRLLVGGDRAGWIDFDRGVCEANADFQGEQTRSDDPGIIYFTSATTGNPKMVLHTQASYGLGHRLTGQLWLDLRPNDVHWNLSDLGWGKAAWSSLYGPWQMGACVFALDVLG
ncbi:MAG: AMP-binding protein, partial [Verrucomicrobia bacterium]|nr:AMP-binding protein [Verrucomicrobiota bacterium]